MIFGYPIGEIVWLALWIIGAGALVGILAGLFGIGGGAIIVPALYEVFSVLGVPEDVRIQLCIGTSLAIIVPTTVRSYLGHKKKGAALLHVLRIWTAPAIAGVVIGSVVAAFAPAEVFKIAFVVFTALIGTKMLFGGESWNLGTQLPGRGLLTVFGFITGLFSSLVGVSGGAVSNAVLTLYGESMQRAVATSAGIGVPITIAGTIGYMIAGWKHMGVLPPLSIGFVSLIGFALMAPVSSYTTTFGVRLAHWLPKRKLEIAFGIFVYIVGLRLLITLL
ncbi:MAG TPA: sulfite exporter TauE/SafE family protein [Pseudolabrys sp.]|nr:sulfite exporter TauE/SafE family protein [Pseudolabrys sp.]